MKNIGKSPRRVVILGAGDGGSSMLDLLLQEKLVEVVAIVDRDPKAPGLVRAAETGIPVYSDVREALKACAPCVAFNLTEDETVEAVAADIIGAGGVIGGLEAKLMWKMVADLRAAKEKLEFQAMHDELTGLYNRRHMLSEMEREISQVMRYDLPFSLVLIDLDHFKKINDTYGHASGDAVLRHVARLLKQYARASDVIGRWGGEEFLVLLPHTPIDSAWHAAGKWLEALRHAPIITPAGETLTVSFSAGIAGYKYQDVGSSLNDAIDSLLARADERLYAAKDAGRACVVGSA